MSTPNYADMARELLLPLSKWDTYSGRVIGPVAAALERVASEAAAVERASCAAYVREQSMKVPHNRSTLSDEVREVLRITADALDAGHRARAKGGA